MTSTADSDRYRRTLLKDVRDERLRVRVTPAVARAWATAQVEPWQAARWVTWDVITPEARPGLSLWDCDRLIEITNRDGGVPSMRWNTPTDQTYRWAGIARCCTVLVQDLTGTDPHADPAGVVALAATLTGPSHSRQWCGFTAGGFPSRRCEPFRLTGAQRQALVGLDLSDVATCLRAGMSIDEATEHARDRRDMEAVRVLAALA